MIDVSASLETETVDDYTSGPCEEALKVTANKLLALQPLLDRCVVFITSSLRPEALAS